jgi:excisionase family DNA binding protein
MAMATSGEKLLLSITEVSQRLNLHRSYVYARLITPGILPACRIGRRRLVHVRDLEEYANSLREQAKAS